MISHGLKIYTSASRDLNSTLDIDLYLKNKIQQFEASKSQDRLNTALWLHVSYIKLINVPLCMG